MTVTTGLESTHRRWVRQSAFYMSLLHGISSQKRFHGAREHPPEVGAAEQFYNKYDKLLGCKLHARYWYQSHCGAVMPTGLESTHRRWVRQSGSFLRVSRWVGKGSTGLESTHRRWVRQSTKFLTDTTHLFDSEFVVIGINTNRL